MIGAVSHNLAENLASMAFFLALAFTISWIAGLKHYFSLPHKTFKGPPVLLQDVFASFFIFIVVYFLVLPSIIATIIHKLPINHRPLYTIFGHLLTFSLTALLLFLYTLLRDRSTMYRVWKDYSFPGSKTLISDSKFGVISWVIAMPIVASVTYIAEIITSLITEPTNKEQVAVKFLKDSLTDPLTSTIAFFSILIVAPLFEEYLFRGLLLSYFRTKLGSFGAIFTSALIFALFHFSPSQSTENVTLLLTLFVFGCYLGFIYEKTRSLLSSIVLHVTFNSISVIRIIFTHV